MTALINIESVTKKGDVFTVEYWDENHEGENNATVQISEKSLLKYIEQEQLNTFSHWTFDYVYSAKTHLEEYQHEVIKDYITANS